MDTPTIQFCISSLCRENWTYICHYLNLRIHNISFENNKPTDVDFHDNGELLSKDKICHIIYTKPDSGDLSQLTYFFLLKRQFDKFINLIFILDVSDIDKKKRNDLIFKYAHYLFLLTKPTKNYLSYKEGKEEPIPLPYSKKKEDASELDSIVNAISSRVFLPLIPVNKNTIGIFTSPRVSNENKGELFDSNDILKSVIRISICKLINDLSSKDTSSLFDEEFPSLFEQWVILAFYNSLNPSERKNHPLSAFKPILHSYCTSIYELAQNIIFHTEKQRGLLYLIFNKTAEEKNVYRELKIGIFDYNPKGVLDTFKDAEHISIKQFYDPNELFDYSRNDEDQIEDYWVYRAAAHLGIKTFVSDVVAHNGTFRVETNNNGNQKLILENGVDSISAPGINGTHYEITLPVRDSAHYDTPLQTTSATDPFARLFNEPVIKEIYPKGDLVFNTSKKEQRDFIEKTGNQIAECPSTSIVLNMDKWRLSSSDLFRLLAYIQLKSHRFEKIICTNLEDSDINKIVENIKRIAKKCDSNKNHIWSITYAVILINKYFRTQILCGETPAEINYVNKQINALYFDTENSFDSYSENISTGHRDILDKLVLPYENIIEENTSEIGKPKIRFINYLEEVIEREIGGKEKKIGCRSEAKNTKIGSKIYIENYYEADFLFHNSFFVDRFAYFIAADIVKWSIDSNINNEKCVIIGYKAYSELLIQKVKDYVDGYGNNHLIVTECLIYDSARQNDSDEYPANNAPDQQNDSDPHTEFHFSTLYQKKTAEADERVAKTIITIVPIGSTLSTNDKILSLYCRVKNIQATDDTYNYYNHCPIIIRSGNTDSNDKLDPTEQQFWTSIDNNIVSTKFTYAKKIHYTLSKKGIWHYLIDSKTFPEKYTDEIYINKTLNSFLNSSEKFGYPLVPPLMGNNPKWEERLFDIYERECLSLGHFVIGDNHVRHFIAVEKYVHSLSKESGSPTFNRWIEEIRSALNPKGDNKIHFLIAPYFHYESGFVKFVNEKVFDGNAFVLFIDIKSSRENLRRKLAYLAGIEQNAHFTFIDNSVLTGKTYHIAVSFLKDIFPERKFRFNAIITFVSRFSNPVYQTLKESLPPEGKILSYFEMLVSPSKDQENTCSLCALRSHYSELLKYSSVRDCRDIIKKNISKFVSVHYSACPVNTSIPPLPRNQKIKANGNSDTKIPAGLRD